MRGNYFVVLCEETGSLEWWSNYKKFWPNKSSYLFVVCEMRVVEM